MPRDFRWNADGNSVQKCGISNQPDICIRDDPCLSKFGQSDANIRQKEMLSIFHKEYSIRISI